jgi:antitoxin YefM
MPKFDFKRKTYYNMYIYFDAKNSMKTVSATNARKNFFQILKETVISHLPLRINSKSGPLVLTSEENYESLVETAELLSINGFKESIQEADQNIEDGDLVAMEDVFAKYE